MLEVTLYNTISLVATILVIVLLLKKYGAKAVVHPFLIFAVTWLPTFIATPLFAEINPNRFLFSPADVIELFQFYLFTLLVIVISTFLLPTKAISKQVGISYEIPTKVFNFFSLLILFATIFKIATNGFDFVDNRNAEVEEVMQIIQTGKASLGKTISSLIISPLNILIIFSAKDILNKIIYGRKFRLSIYKLLPFLCSILITISGGGRANLFATLILLLLGFGFYYNHQIPIKKLLIKGALWFALVVIPINTYSTFIASERSNAKGYEHLIIIDNENLQFFNGVLEYSYWHVLGYQFRKNDAFPTEPNGIRGNTFGFFKNITFPLSSQFGAKNNLGELFDIEKPQYFHLTDATSITATVYFNLYSDLGYTGTLIAIIIFTLFTQILFRKTIRSPIRSIFFLGLYMFVFSLWRTSWFYNVLGNINLISVFVPYFIVWFGIKISNNNQRRI